MIALTRCRARSVKVTAKTKGDIFLFYTIVNLQFPCSSVNNVILYLIVDSPWQLSAKVADPWPRTSFDRASCDFIVTTKKECVKILIQNCTQVNGSYLRLHYDY